MAGKSMSSMPDPKVSLVGLQLTLFDDWDAYSTEQQAQIAWERACGAHEASCHGALDLSLDAMPRVVFDAEGQASSKVEPAVHDHDGGGHDAQAEQDEGAHDPDQFMTDEQAMRFFIEEGRRLLLAEMVIQSVRDMAAMQDAERCERLRRTDPETLEEIQASAQWLDTTNGHIALQMLYPDWDHRAIVQRIKQDPQGVVDRFVAWASLAPKKRSTDDDLPDYSFGSAPVDLGGYDVADDDMGYVCRG